MTSEERNNIAEQPGDTCPMLDEVINALSEASAEIERIRKHVEAIRVWGGEWKELAIDTIAERDDLQHKADTLEQSLDEANGCIKELEGMERAA